MDFRIRYIIFDFIDSHTFRLPQRCTHRFVITGRQITTNAGSKCTIFAVSALFQPRYHPACWVCVCVCDGISHLSTQSDKEKHKIKHSPSIMSKLQVFYFYALNFKCSSNCGDAHTHTNTHRPMRETHSERLRCIVVYTLEFTWIIYMTSDSSVCVCVFETSAAVMHFYPSWHRNDTLPGRISFFVFWRADFIFHNFFAFRASAHFRFHRVFFYGCTCRWKNIMTFTMEHFDDTNAPKWIVIILHPSVCLNETKYMRCVECYWLNGTKYLPTINALLKRWRKNKYKKKKNLVDLPNERTCGTERRPRKLQIFPNPVLEQRCHWNIQRNELLHFSVKHRSPFRRSVPRCNLKNYVSQTVATSRHTFHAKINGIGNQGSAHHNHRAHLAGHVKTDIKYLATFTSSNWRNCVWHSMPGAHSNDHRDANNYCDEPRARIQLSWKQIAESYQMQFGAVPTARRAPLWPGVDTMKLCSRSTSG